MAVAGRPAVAAGPVPADAVGRFGGDVVADRSSSPLRRLRRRRRRAGRWSAGRCRFRSAGAARGRRSRRTCGARSWPRSGSACRRSALGPACRCGWAGEGRCRSGVGAPPVSAGAGVAKQARKTASAIIDIDPPSQGPAPALLRATCPLFRSPAELAVGLALKEMRYGPSSSDSPLGPARVPAVPPLPSAVRLGFGYCWRGSIELRPGQRGTARRAETS